MSEKNLAELRAAEAFYRNAQKIVLPVGVM